MKQSFFFFLFQSRLQRFPSSRLVHASALSSCREQSKRLLSNQKCTLWLVYRRCLSCRRNAALQEDGLSRGRAQIFNEERIESPRSRRLHDHNTPSWRESNGTLEHGRNSQSVAKVHVEPLKSAELKISNSASPHTLHHTHHTSCLACPVRGCWFKSQRATTPVTWRHLYE